MFYYNQNDYSTTPYPKPNGEYSTVARGGCGVVSACIVFNNLADKELYTVPQMAKFSLKRGARGNNGTDEKVLLKALCEANKAFSFKTSSDVKELVKHLKAGGMAICNQGDAYNVFSTAGHFVVAYKMNGKNIEIVDPQMYSGKYDSYARPTRIVKKTSTGCIISTTELAKATADRNPAYYLVTYTKPKVKAPKVKNGTYKLTNVRGVYNGWGAKSGRKLVGDLTEDGRKHATSNRLAAEAYLYANTPVTITATKLLSSGNLWAKIPSGYLCIWEADKNKLFIK